MFSITVGELDEHEDNLDRSDYSPCDPCYVGINDLGLHQCRNCLGLFIGKTGREAVIKCLKSDYGELWHEEYENLKRVKSLVQRGKLEQLRMVRCKYRGEGDKMKTERYFYEKVRSD